MSLERIRLGLKRPFVSDRVVIIISMRNVFFGAIQKYCKTVRENQTFGCVGTVS